jgi:endonuclease/exonuclease/phosphatase family metal-dependent hydrolase
MRFMTYNILNGGQERQAVLLEVIGAAAPDVLALQECNGFELEDARVLRAWEAALGMRALLAPSDSGDHVALFARAAEWRDERVLRAGMARAAAIATLTLHGQTVAAAALHLDPFDPDARRAEATRVVAALPAGVPAVIMGDLNAVSPRDVRRMQPEAWPERYRTRHGLARGAIDTQAIAALEAAGFVDLGAAGASGPALTRPTRLYADRDVPAQRLDYIFATRALAPRLRAAGVIDDRRTQQASDHLPVFADVTW